MIHVRRVNLKGLSGVSRVHVLNEERVDDVTIKYPFGSQSRQDDTSAILRYGPSFVCMNLASEGTKHKHKRAEKAQMPCVFPKTIY